MLSGDEGLMALMSKPLGNFTPWSKRIARYLSASFKTNSSTNEAMSGFWAAASISSANTCPVWSLCMNGSNGFREDVGRFMEDGMFMLVNGSLKFMSRFMS